MKGLKCVTTKEYADMRGITIRAVNKAVSQYLQPDKWLEKFPAKYNRREPKLPLGVKKVKKYGRFYLLHVDEKEITSVT